MGNSEEKRKYEEEVQDTLLEEAELKKKAKRLVDLFYINHDRADVCSVIDLICEKGNPKNREFLNSFKKKMEDGELDLQEIARYNDLYDQHKILLIK